MKLALISPDAIAECFICRWKWKAPLKKRGGEPIPPEQQVKYLEENIIAHLRDCHDRLLITKEENPPEEEGGLGRIYYHGRRPLTENQWRKI